MRYVLRPYQEAAIEGIRAKVREGKKRVVLVAPTGSGKTTIAASIIESAIAKGSRCLFLTHRKELIEQASARLDSIGIDHGVIQASHKRARPWCSVHVASVATLVRRLGNRPDVQLIIVDEAHHAMSESWIKVLAAYPKAAVIGLTATPWRLDGKGLKGIFEDVVVVAQAHELVPEYLMAPRIFAPDKPNLSKVHTTAGDYDVGELEEVMAQTTLVGNVVEHWQKLAGGARSLVFAVTVRHSLALRDRFREAGVAAEHLDATSHPDDRAAILARLKSGETRVVTNCQILTEGFDLPELGCVSLARPTQSSVLFLQMCLDEKTEILTRRGWMGPNDILKDDSVAGLDLQSNAVDWAPILSLTDRSFVPGEGMFEVSTPGIDLRVTGKHRLVVSRPRFSQIRQAVIWPNWQAADASDVHRFRSNFRIPVAAIQEAPGLPLTDDEIRFIGWFLTDGSINKRTNGISIYQATHQPHFCEIEKCIQGCGFKYGMHVRWPEGKFKASSMRAQFTISKGLPRGTDKHLRGWEDLEQYIDKNLSPAMESIDARQLGVLLESIHLGDGSKQINQSWTRRSYHVSTGNRVFADRLQSLCVRRGWRCNIAIATYNANPLYVLHIKNQTFRSIGGACAKDRVGLRESVATAGERVWCVENRLGTIFIRRNGKVCIVGNCGRILRPAPGKAAPIVLDHADCVRRHGHPLDPREYSLEDMPKLERGRKGKAETEDRAKVCGQCFAIAAMNARVCPECGAPFTPSGPVGVVETGTELKEQKAPSIGTETPINSAICSACGSKNIRPIRKPERWGVHRHLVICGKCGHREFRVEPTTKATQDEKRAEFERLEQIRIEKQFAKGWTWHKFREVFGVWPSRYA